MTYKAVKFILIPCILLIVTFFSASCVTEEDYPQFERLENFSFNKFSSDSIKIEGVIVLRNKSKTSFKISDIELNLGYNDVDIPVNVNHKQTLEFNQNFIEVPVDFNISQSFIEKNGLNMVLNALFEKKVVINAYGALIFKKSLFKKSIPFKEKIEVKW